MLNRFERTISSTQVIKSNTPTFTGPVRTSVWKVGTQVCVYQHTILHVSWITVNTHHTLSRTHREVLALSDLA